MSDLSIILVNWNTRDVLLDCLKSIQENPPDRPWDVWLVDNGDHTVRKFTKDGELLLLLGKTGEHGLAKDRFYRPTDIAFAADGSFYVSDGYGNSRVVKYSPKGEYLLEWGKKGTAPGEFNLPHVVQVEAVALHAEHGQFAFQIGSRSMQVDQQALHLDAAVVDQRDIHVQHERILVTVVTALEAGHFHGPQLRQHQAGQAFGSREVHLQGDGLSSWWIERIRILEGTKQALV